MLTLRIVILSVMFIFVIAGIGYLTVSPTSAMVTESNSESCAAVSFSALSTEELKDILKGRYERRVGLPR